MELLRSIRLEQVNWALRSNETRKSLDLNKIGEIANHFEFTSRGHFRLRIKIILEKHHDKH